MKRSERANVRATKPFAAAHVRHATAHGIGIGLLCISVLPGCAAYRTQPVAQTGFMKRTETQTDGNVSVTAAVLSGDESRKAFGVDLAGKGIQPVWLKIVNQADAGYWLFPVRMDPNYYSPLETAWRYHGDFSAADRKRMETWFCQQQIPFYIPGGATVSGVVFTNLRLGAKEVVVELVAPSQSKSFIFFAKVPGIRPEIRKVDAEALYGKDKVISCNDTSLRAELENLPSSITDKTGKRKGDPLNLVVIGEVEEIWPAFVARGWNVAEQLYGRSAWETFESFFFGSSYPYAPMSALYAYGRGQDVGFEKTRETINDRNHLRLWLTPLRYNGKPVLVGAITRDIGIMFSLKSGPLLLTHKIDSDIDDSRDYLVQDLLSSHRVAKIGFVKGCGASTPPNPRQNLTGDEMFTDGLRAVFVMASKPVAMTSVERFDWERPGSPLFAPGR